MEKLVWDLGQHACAVTGYTVRIHGTAMLHIAHAAHGHFQNVPTAFSVDVRNETDTTGVFFVLDEVKTAFVGDILVVECVFHGAKNPSQRVKSGEGIQPVARGIQFRKQGECQP